MKIFLISLAIICAVVGFALMCISFLRIIKLIKGDKKTGDDNCFSDNEKAVLKKSIKILIIGVAFICIACFMYLIMIFLK